MFAIGYCAYIAIEVSWRGISYPVMGILAGISVIILDYLNNWFGWDMDLLLQGSIGSAIITYFELIVGEFIKVNHLQPMWNYNNVPLNYDGVICLPFSLLWIVMSIIAIFIADAINYYMTDDDEVPYYKIFTKQILKFKEKK